MTISGIGLGARVDICHLDSLEHRCRRLKFKDYDSNLKSYQDQTTSPQAVEKVPLIVHRSFLDISRHFFTGFSAMYTKVGEKATPDGPLRGFLAP